MGVESTLRFPVVTTFGSLTPIFFHLLSWFSEVAKCKLTGVNNSLNGPERLSREKELSDSCR